MPSSIWLAPGLRFNDCYFSEPVRFVEWLPPTCPGLAVLLVRDPDWAPKPFRPLCFVEFGNDVRRAFDAGSWLRATAHAVYGSVLPMPFSTSAERRAIRNQLISSYNPIYQTDGLPSTDELTRRLDDLEAHQQGQNAQILALLSHIAKLFEPQPVAPRRPIGFLPRSAPLAAQSGS
jgi:hypothetical protein